MTLQHPSNPSPTHTASAWHFFSSTNAAIAASLGRQRSTADVDQSPASSSKASQRKGWRAAATSTAGRQQESLIDWLAKSSKSPNLLHHVAPISSDPMARGYLWFFVFSQIRTWHGLGSKAIVDHRWSSWKLQTTWASFCMKSLPGFRGSFVPSYFLLSRSM